MVTAAAQADLQTVVAQAETPTDARTALFAATPLVVGDYGDAAAALALDWYEELRDAANPSRPFAPVPLTKVDDDALMSTVAWSTQSLYDLEQKLNRELDANTEALGQAVDEAMARLLPEVQRQIAAGFRDTVVENSIDDPDAVGWQRFARGDACKFCQMLASRGAVYVEATANFAAHTDDHCLAGPSFNADAPRASAMQYVASQRRRTAKERAALRDYLNEHYPDARG